MSKKNKILLIGTGYMGLEYAKVLQALKLNFLVVGRGTKSAAKFKKQTKIKVITGGVEKYLAKNKDIPQRAIVATTGDTLGKVTLALLKHGVKQILVEKPGGFNENEIKKIATKAKKVNAKVYVGYNRRFYASVKKAQEITKKDGGATSFMFEFTEWGHVIEKLEKDKKIKHRWFLHNSTHVVDMAFFMCGRPKKLTTFTQGSLDWHPKASSFSGAGITEKNIPFSYIANWDAPGRWSLEIMTKKHRLIFRPLEKLQIQNKGSVAVEEVKIDDKIDLKYKPGLYLQVKSFLTNRNSLCTIEEQVTNLKYYRQILKK